MTDSKAPPSTGEEHNSSRRPAARVSGDGPPTVGRRVNLRTIVPTDFDYLYRLSTDPQHSSLWRFRGGTPSPESFSRLLWDKTLCQFLVTRRANDEPIGIVSAYGADFKNGFAYVAMIVDPHWALSPLAYESSLLFINYLFATFGFRKLYGETGERQVGGLFRGAIGRYFEVEGCLKQHEYFNGRYWDAYIVALYREAWAELLAERLPRLLPRDDA